MAQRVDSLGMWEATMGLPEQIERAAEVAAAVTGLPAHDDIENVVVLGMGGSGIAGDVLTVVAGPFMAVPIVVHKSYSIPNFIGEQTLVLAVSFSGNTEETVEAATEAALAGGRVVTICAGGQLAELSRAWGTPSAPVDATIPMPRAAIGAMAVPALVLMESMGFFPGARSWIECAVEQLRKRRDQLAAEHNVARALATSIGRSIPLAHGGGGIGAVAALRFKNQVNENPKSPAFWNVHPELCHNELAGWAQHGDVTRQVLHLVNFRHEYEHPQVMRRFDYVAEALGEVVGGVDEVVAEGEGPLAQLFDLILTGDAASLHLAFDAGVDPGPIPVLEDLKHALAQD